MTASDDYSGPKQKSSTLEESHWQLLINKRELFCLFTWLVGCFGLVFDFLLLFWVLVLILLAFWFAIDLVIWYLDPNQLYPLDTIAIASGTIYLYVHLFPVFLSPKINLQMSILDGDQKMKGRTVPLFITPELLRKSFFKHHCRWRHIYVYIKYNIFHLLNTMTAPWVCPKEIICVVTTL